MTVISNITLNIIYIKDNFNTPLEKNFRTVVELKSTSNLTSLMYNVKLIIEMKNMFMYVRYKYTMSDFNLL